MLDLNDREVLEKFDAFVRDSKECLEQLDGTFSPAVPLLESFLSFADLARQTLEQEAAFEQSREDFRLENELNDHRCGGA